MIDLIFSLQDHLPPFKSGSLIVPLLFLPVDGAARCFPSLPATVETVALLFKVYDFIDKRLVAGLRASIRKSIW